MIRTDVCTTISEPLLKNIYIKDVKGRRTLFVPWVPVGPWIPEGPGSPKAPGDPAAPAGPSLPTGPLSPLGPKEFSGELKS